MFFVGAGGESEGFAGPSMGRAERGEADDRGETGQGDHPGLTSSWPKRRQIIMDNTLLRARSGASKVSAPYEAKRPCWFALVYNGRSRGLEGASRPLGVNSLSARYEGCYWLLINR